MLKNFCPNTYVIDQSGRWRLLLRYGTLIEDIASDVRYLVRNEGT